MKPKAWIFDLGNTLMSVPSEFDEELRLQQILGWSDIEEIRTVIYRICFKHPGQSVDEFMVRFDRAVNQSADDQLSRDVRAAWLNSVAHAQLSPGAWQVLDDLRSLGMKLALVSNTPPVSHLIIDKLDLRHRFDEIVFSCDTGYLKPDPRIFQVALDRLGVIASESVVVGDKIRTDILGGAILGMRSILLEVRLRAIVENAQNYVDAIVPSLAHLSQTSLYRSAT